MVEETEILNRAAAIERIHGDRAEAYVDERIESCRQAGRHEALALWQAIAAVLGELHKISQPVQVGRPRIVQSGPE